MWRKRCHTHTLTFRLALGIDRSKLVSRVPTRKVTFPLMSDVTCTRCGQTRERLAAPPFRNEFGNRIYDSICQACWSEWLQHQTAVINHYALDLRDPRAREFLTTQTETYLFGPPQA